MKRFCLFLPLAACLNSGSQPTGKISGPTAAEVGQVVQLDGTQSTDKNKNGLTYMWRFVSVPAGSGAAFNNPTAPAPTFSPDVQGTYVVGLVVTDGAASNSVSQTIAVTGTCFTISNTASGDQGEKVSLVSVSSNASCANAQANFQWSILQRPAGSTATINGTGFDPNFIPDQSGAYVVAYSAQYGSSAFLPPAQIAVTVQSCAPQSTIEVWGAVPASGVTPQASIGETVLFSAQQMGQALACGHGIVSAQWEQLSTPPGGAANSYLLTDSGLSVQTGATPSSLSASFFTTTPGAFSFGLTLTDDHGLVSHSEQKVNIAPMVNVAQQPGNEDEFDYTLQNNVPWVVYTDTDENGIVFASFDAQNLVWDQQIIVADPAENTSIFAHSALGALGGQPCVAYIVTSVSAGTTSLNFVCRKADGTWPTIASPYNPTNITPAVDGHISVVVNAAGTELQVLYVSAEDTAQFCTTTSTTSGGNISINGCSAGPSITASTTLTQPMLAKMVQSPTNVPHVVFADVPASGPEQLVVVPCTSATCTAFGTKVPIIEAGSFNYAYNDDLFSTQIGSDNVLRVLYTLDDKTDLHFASCSTSKCTTSSIANDDSYYDPAFYLSSTGDVQAMWVDNTLEDLVRGTLSAGSNTWTITPLGFFVNLDGNDINYIYDGLQAIALPDGAGNFTAMYWAGDTNSDLTDGLRFFDRPE